MISVITPIFNPNREMWERSYNSIKDQLSEDFEWIVVFDGSNMNEVVDTIPYEEIKSDHIHVVTVWENYGPSVARNVGFQISRGDYIGYLDIGDSLDPDYYNNVKYLVSNFDEDMFFLGYEIIEPRNDPHDSDAYFELNFKINYFDVEKLHAPLIDIIQRQNIAIPMGVVHKRKPFVEAGGFQPGIVCGEDGLLWRRMLTKDNYIATNLTAGIYRINQSGQSRTQRRFERGGFAFDGDHPNGTHGQYLDEQWFKEFNSKGLYE